MADAATVGTAIDAELAPAKCAGWSPAGAPAPAGWTGGWATDGVEQFSVPLGDADFVAAGVDVVAVEHRALVAAIAVLPPAELQAQLLLLRLCAGPRANYWLRALPLVASARLVAAVDTDSRAVLGRLIFDARDSPAVQQAGLDRRATGGRGVLSRPPCDGGRPSLCAPGCSRRGAVGGCGRGRFGRRRWTGACRADRGRGCTARCGCLGCGFELGGGHARCCGCGRRPWPCFRRGARSGCGGGGGRRCPARERRGL